MPSAMHYGPLAARPFAARWGNAVHGFRMSELELSRDATSALRQWITPVAASLAFVGLTTAALLAMQARLQQEHLIFIYLLPVALMAVRYGSLSAVGVIASGVVAAYLIYAPRFSFEIASPLDLTELLLFCVLGLLAGRVVAGVAGDRAVAGWSWRIGMKRRGRAGQR